MAEVVDDKLVANQRRHLQSKASGVEVDYLVLAFREGEAIRDEWFAGRETALEVGRAGASPRLISARRGQRRRPGASCRSR